MCMKFSDLKFSVQKNTFATEKSLKFCSVYRGLDPCPNRVHEIASLETQRMSRWTRTMDSIFHKNVSFRSRLKMADHANSLDCHMSLLGVKLDNRNLVQTDGLQVQLMQMLQLMAEYGLQFKEIDKRIDQNVVQIRDLKSVFMSHAFADLLLTTSSSFISRTKSNPTRVAPHKKFNLYCLGVAQFTAQGSKGRDRACGQQSRCSRQGGQGRITRS